jgi:hypothetical protein
MDVIRVYEKLGKGNRGRSWEAERACFSAPGAFKTFPNLWEGKNQVIPIQ